MLEEIPKVINIPDGLIIAASQKNLAPFIGAGVSKLAGYPGWDEFATEALKFFIVEGKFSFAQLDQEYDPGSSSELESVPWYLLFEVDKKGELDNVCILKREI